MADSVIAILQSLLARKGTTKKAVAMRVGRSRQWLDSALKGAPVGVAVCLRLARLEGLNRIDLLRTEGHDDVADELVAAGLEASTLILNGRSGTPGETAHAGPRPAGTFPGAHHESCRCHLSPFGLSR